MAELNGIDVSQYQGNIDWSKVKASGISFAMIRVGRSTIIDEKFTKNMSEALKVGLKCGCYLYSKATTPAQAQTEADFVIKNIKPYRILYPVAFDIEDETSQGSLSNEQRTDIIIAFCDKIKSAGYIPGVYSSVWWFNNKFDLSRISNYDFWIAEYGVTAPTFSGNYAIWQNSQSGNVPGILGPVDTNISYKDYT